MKLLVFSLLIVVVVAHDLNPKLPLFGMKIGKCPRLKTMENFNLTAVAGRWYELYRLPHVFFMGMKCNRMDAYPQKDGSLKTKSAAFVKKAKSYVGFNGEWWHPNGAPSGLTLYEFKGPSYFSGVYTVQVICTDYDKVLVNYACMEVAEGALHYDFLDVMSRTPQICPEKKKEIKDKLHGMGFDVTQILPVEQFECPQEDATLYDYEWKFDDSDIFDDVMARENEV